MPKSKEANTFYTGVEGSRHGTNLVWFRKDLRVLDNSSLAAACNNAAKMESQRIKIEQATTAPLVNRVIGLYVLCGDQFTRHDYAPTRVNLILGAVKALQTRLWNELRIPLILLTPSKFSDIARVVYILCKELDVSNLYFSTEYELDELNRDLKLKGLCAASSVKITEFHDECVVHPDIIKSQKLTVYSMFTPYMKAWKRHLEKDIPVCCTATTGNSLDAKFPKFMLPDFADVAKHAIKDYVHKMTTIQPDNQDSDLFAKLFQQSCVSVPDSVKKIHGYQMQVPDKLFDLQLTFCNTNWIASEEAAQAKLDNFIKTKILNYGETRNNPQSGGTSELSPYFSTGVLSARYCYVKAAALKKNLGAISWIVQLCWRDYFRYTCKHFPKVCMNKPLQTATEKIKWNDPSPEIINCWKEGRTGFPIIDAGIMQLRTTGWLHNRLRMLLATFLVKNLLIDWRIGERFFMLNLIDGDFPSNNGSWQWCASCGTQSSQPYFRVFNPLRQSETYDPSGEYIRRFLPQLKEINSKNIHDPYSRLSREEFLALNYPEPMVDFKKTRVRAIEAYRIILKPTAGDKRQRDEESENSNY